MISIGESSGEVEILANGRYGSICDSSWDMKDAAVVCRQLGFLFAIATDQYTAQQHPPPVTVFLSNLSCTGTESNVHDCPFNTSYHCKHQLGYTTLHTFLECAGMVRQE